MTTIIEGWQKHLESEAERINASKELSKDENFMQASQFKTEISKLSVTLSGCLKRSGTRKTFFSKPYADLSGGYVESSGIRAV